MNTAVAKSSRKWLLLLTSLFVLALVAVGPSFLSQRAEAASPQGGGGGGNWSVGAGGSQTVVNGAPAAGTCTVSNNGNSTVTVEVKNSEGAVVSTTTINKDSSSSVGVPTGGSVTVKDGHGAGGASGTYNYSPLPQPK